MKTLSEVINTLPTQRRRRIEAEAAALIANENMRRGQLRNGTRSNEQAARPLGSDEEPCADPTGADNGSRQPSEQVSTAQATAMRDAADKPIDPFAVVALICDLPDSGLVAGQVGSIVQPVAPDAYEVEFTDDAGQTYTSAAIPANRLLVLHYAPAAQAST